MVRCVTGSTPVPPGWGGVADVWVCACVCSADVLVCICVLVDEALREVADVWVWMCVLSSASADVCAL